MSSSYVLDYSSFKYLLMDITEEAFPDIWKIINEKCRSNMIVSDREALKLLQKNLIDEENLQWVESNKDIFRQINEQEAEILGGLVSRGLFLKMSSVKRSIIENSPVSVPFLVAVSKNTRSVLVIYKHNPEYDVIKRITEEAGIKCISTSEFLAEIRGLKNGSEQQNRFRIYVRTGHSFSPLTLSASSFIM